jgi:hypothetical protein
MELIQCYKHFASSLKHFLQILQKLEFIHVKFLLSSQKLWQGKPA